MKKISYFSSFALLAFLLVSCTQHHRNDPQMTSSPIVPQPQHFSSNVPETHPTLKEQIGQMLMVGFEGTSLSDPGVMTVAQYIQNGQVGHIIYFGYNIQTPQQVQALNTFFKSRAPRSRLLIAVDQEGGRVTRLTEEKGFPVFNSAKQVAQSMTPQQAEAYYRNMAKVAADAGFNLVLAPVVDLEYHPLKQSPQALNPVIGQLGRAYSADPDLVTRYAKAFINAHHNQGLLTSLKHFPGHGLAITDSHKGLVDITHTFDPIELRPYYNLMQSGHIDMVMTAHVTHRAYDDIYPATLSPHIIKKFLRDHGYDGVVISDDLFMGAIQQNFDLKKTVLQAIKADVDILMFSCNAAAQKGIVSRPDQFSQKDIINQVTEIILQAIEQGEITRERIQKSYDRVQALKSKQLT